MSGNSLFDPDPVIGGHRPYGIAEWDNLYKAYRVHASKFRFNVASDDGVPAIVMVQPKNIVTAIPTLANFPTERAYVKSRMIGAELGPGLRTIKHFMTTAKIFGVRKVEIKTNPDFSAPMTANPNTQWYWQIRVEAMNQVDIMTKRFWIEIEYYAELYDRLNVNQST